MCFCSWLYIILFLLWWVLFHIRICKRRMEVYEPGESVVWLQWDDLCSWKYCPHYFQYLRWSHEGPIPIKKGILVPGFQDDGTCILNDSTFIDPSGVLLDPECTDFVWLSRDLVHETSKIRSKDITPQIVHPFTAEPYTICMHCVRRWQSITSFRHCWW